MESERTDFVSSDTVSELSNVANLENPGEAVPLESDPSPESDCHPSIIDFDIPRATEAAAADASEDEVVASPINTLGGKTDTDDRVEASEPDNTRSDSEGSHRSDDAPRWRISYSRGESRRRRRRTSCREYVTMTSHQDHLSFSFLQASHTLANNISRGQRQSAKSTTNTHTYIHTHTHMSTSYGVSSTFSDVV